MSAIPYTLIPNDQRPAPMGLIVLQTDESIEPELNRSFTGHEAPLYVSRIPSGLEVTPDSLASMETHLPASADLLPKACQYSVVGYGCTSASAIIGSDKIEELVKRTCDTRFVTNPLKAATAFAGHHGLSKLALLSPYIEQVNDPLRAAFSKNGISTDVFGTFAESEEAKVVRISHASIVSAAKALGSDSAVEGVFISCTNLRTFDALPEIQKIIGKPVFSSNSSLAWHMLRSSMN